MPNLSQLRFELVVASTVKCGQGWHLPERAWTDHRLMLVRGGCGELEQAGRRVPLRRGSVVFGLPGEIYGVRQDERKKLSVSVLRFRALTRARRETTLAEFRPALVFQPAGFPLLEQAAIRLTHAVPSVPAAADDLGDALLRALLWLVRDDRPQTDDHQGPNHAYQDLKPALEHLRTLDQREPGVTVLARLCGLSVSTFRRRMQECFGQSPKQYILRTRLDRAQGLLLESPYTVEAIAAELGYSEPAHFSRQFKQHTGLSPARFRASHQ